MEGSLEIKDDMPEALKEAILAQQKQQQQAAPDYKAQPEASELKEANKNKSLASKVVKNYDDLDEATKKQLDEAILKAKAEGKLGKDPDTAALDKEMEKLKSEIDWDKIEKDADGIPVVNDSDCERIIGIGASTPDELRLIIRTARETIKATKEEIDNFDKEEVDLKAEEESVKDLPEDDQKKKDVVEKRQKFNTQKNASVNAKQSSMDTLAAFQDLARKTIQSLIDDNAFVKTISIIANNIFTEYFPDSITKSIIASYVGEELKFIDDTDQDIINSLKTAFNPMMNKSYNYYDSVSFYAQNTTPIFAEQKGKVADVDKSLITKAYRFNNSFLSMYKYPFAVASRYIPQIDLLYTGKDLSDDYNISPEKQKIGWPSLESVFNSAEVNARRDDIIGIINDIEAFINTNYDFICKQCGILANVLSIYAHEVSNAKKTSITRKFDTFIKYVTVENNLTYFQVIHTKQRPNPDFKADQPIDEKNNPVVNLTDDEVKRYIYMAFILIILSFFYTKTTNSIFNKIEGYSKGGSIKDSARDVYKYIISELQLSMNIVESYNKNEEGASISKFITEDIYKDLTHEIDIMFNNLNIDEARTSIIYNSINISYAVLSVVRKIICNI